ncbi:uncharacterized protein EAF01_002230 [Botrytis porri]|uniref:uncharacterized protein n=1 Tax=Botrytis porri TaxID=87229 RepID=UPI0018FF5083|nr:uncharacterized protein EAF01_002230 [Botrytis porri]KAF7910721.1 hypothetical protein EAF01_002230 [Botrytis porri]
MPKVMSRVISLCQLDDAMRFDCCTICTPGNEIEPTSAAPIPKTIITKMSCADHFPCTLTKPYSQEFGTNIECTSSTALAELAAIVFPFARFPTPSSQKFPRWSISPRDSSRRCVLCLPLSVSESPHDSSRRARGCCVPIRPGSQRLHQVSSIARTSWTSISSTAISGDIAK